MSATVSLSTLRTRVRQRCEMESSEFVSDSELNSYLNASYAMLYNELLRASPELWTREQTLTGDGSSSTFDVASDYRSTLQVSYQQSGQRSRLRRLSIAQCDDYDQTEVGIGCAYTLRYNSTTPSTPKIRIYPIPRSGDTYIHTYIVTPPVMTGDSDVIDGVSGFEEFVVLDSAIKCLIKEESTAQAQSLMAERNRVLENIKLTNTRIYEPGGISDAANRERYMSDVRFLRGL